MISLSPRLKKISDLIENSNVMADIGTDHAYLPVSLLSNRKTKVAIASDIKSGPLKRAEETVKKYNMTDKVSLRLGAGLETIAISDKVDTIVIAGMGGFIISSILENSRDVVKNSNQVILQPMTMTQELREYLYENEFDEICEYLAVEGEKIYNIISAKPGNKKHKPLSDLEKYIGRDIIKNKPEHFNNYLNKQINKLENILCAIQNTESEDVKKKNLEILLDEINKIN